jgi:AcrR family transcriptional regulator
MARRTQAERKAATVAKLIDAAASALVEVGWAGASVQVICARAGVSQGALFRHFPTREALMVATAAHLGTQILQRYRRRFGALAADRTSDPLRVALGLLRETCRSRPNQAFYELAIAARTNPRLRKAIAKTSAAYYAEITDAARQLMPDLAASLGPNFEVLVDTVVAIFDGEQIQRFLTPKPAIEASRIDVVAALVASAASSSARTKTA